MVAEISQCHIIGNVLQNSCKQYDFPIAVLLKIQAFWNVMLCQLRSSRGFQVSQGLNHAPNHTMLYTTRLVSSVQLTTEDRTIPPTTSTEVLTQMSAIFHHTNQIQILKMFSTASLAVISPFFSPLPTLPTPLWCYA